MLLAHCLTLGTALLIGSAAAGAGKTGHGSVRGQTESGSGVFHPDVFSARLSCRPQIALSGTWQFRRDAEDQGKAQRWHEGVGEFAASVQVPGAPQAQGVGTPTAKQKTA